ncbi:MAG: hypothetical protein HZA91_06325 [Verrucomicrobia bacterium]|nr:hypothetical protein [Verrucomicrobiota bacterium]
MAGVTKEEGWVRLYPISFRHLPKERRFTKYQLVRLRMRKHEEARPESYRPDQESLVLGEVLSSKKTWQARKDWLLKTANASMCEILRLQREHGKSLGMFKPRCAPDLKIEKADKEWNDIVNQLHFFEEPDKPLEPIPFRFKYRYVCDDAHCKGHEQTIVDWEACELYRKLRDSETSEQAVRAKMRQKWVEQLWGGDKDSYLFVGNQLAHPRSFIVLGVFWPPKIGDEQQMKLL